MARHLIPSDKTIRSIKLGQIIDEIEHLKASVRAKVEHAFRVVKRQFGHTKVRYRGLVENTAQLHTLFALTNLWMARKSGKYQPRCMSSPPG